MIEQCHHGQMVVTEYPSNLFCPRKSGGGRGDTGSSQAAVGALLPVDDGVADCWPEHTN